VSSSERGRLARLLIQSRTILTSEVIDCHGAADLVSLASKEGMFSIRLPAIGASAERDDEENAWTGEMF